MPPGNRIDARAGASMPGTGPGTGKTSVPMGRGFGGVNNFWALQNRSLPAFQNPHSGVPFGLGNSAQEIGARMTQAGNLLLPDGRYVPDTMYTRTMGSMGPQQNAAIQPQGPNPDQMRWAQAFANAQQAPAGLAVPNQMGGNSLLGAVGLNPLTGAGQSPSSFKGFSGAPTQTAPPTNFSRAALIEGAKKSGEFKDIMSAYNRNAQGTGYRMDQYGNINPLSKTADDQGTSPFAREVYGPGAQDIAARRDFARGESPVQKFDPMAGPNADEMNPQPIQFSKMNPYGSATATSAPSKGGMMRHEITGKMVPMSPYLAEKRAIQDTKIKPLGSEDANRFRNLVRKGRMA